MIDCSLPHAKTINESTKKKNSRQIKRRHDLESGGYSSKMRLFR